MNTRSLIGRFAAMTATATIAVALMAGTAWGQTTTTFTGTAGNYNNDTWNQLSGGLPQYWDNGIPSGAGPWQAVISSGSKVYVTSGYLGAGESPTPAYTGNLTLQTNVYMEFGVNSTDTDFNALGTGTITMNSGSGIFFRRSANSVHNQNIVLAGDAQIDPCLSTSAHIRSRTFNGTISGSGKLTTRGESRNTMIFTANNSGWSGGLRAYNGTSMVTGAGTGCFGTGDVTIDPSQSLKINVANAIADSAKLYLSGTPGTDAGSATTKLVMNANDSIFKLFLDGVEQPSGTYGSTTNLGVDYPVAWISGNGVLTVIGVPKYYWDLNGATAGAGGSTPAGVWDATNTYWNSAADGTGSVAAWSPGQVALFAAGGDATGTYTVTVGGTQDIGGLTFEEGTVALSGGGLRMSTDSLMTVAAGQTASIETPLSDDGTPWEMTKSGNGTLLLSGSSSYAGLTRVGGGILSVANIGNAGANSPLGAYPAAGAGGIVLAGGTLEYSGGSASVDRGVTVNSNSTIDVSVPGTVLTLGDSLSAGAGGTLTVTGGSLALGQVKLAATSITLNPTGGAMTVASAVGDTRYGFAAPTLTLGGTASGNVLTGNVTYINVHPSGWDPGMNVAKSGGGDWTIDGAVNSGGTMTVSGGTLTLNGTSTYTGATTVQSGTIIAGNNVPNATNQNGAFGRTNGTINVGLANGNNDAGVRAGGAYTIARNFQVLSQNVSDTGIRTVSFGGNTAAAATFSGNIILGTTNQSTKGISLTAANGGQVTFSGVISNPTGQDGTEAANAAAGTAVTKVGPGTVILTNTSTYTGRTVVDEGLLLVNGSLASSSLAAVNPGGTLGGTGVLGPLSLSGGTLSPGASVGTLAAGSTTWNDGSSFRFEIDDASGAAGVAGGPGWDLLNITGTLDLTALTVGGFTVVVDTLLPGGANNPGSMENFNPDLGYSWEFARTTGGVTGFDAAKFLFDMAGFANPYTGTFEVAIQGNSLYVTFSPSMDITDPGVSTVAASPPSIPADGVSTSTITVTVKATDGTGLEGKDVTLANTAGPGMAVIAPATPVTTDANGVATFTVSSNTVGTEEFTATDVTDADNHIVIAQTASVAFSIVSQTSLIAGYTPPPPPSPDAPQTSLAGTTNPPPPESQTAAQDTSEATDPLEDPVPGVIRVTEYYLTTGGFAGTTATLTLDQDLAADYFILVRGSRDGNGLSMPDSDYARVAAVPGGGGGLADAGAADRIGLRRAAAEFDWEGVVTVVECLAPDSPAGFRLVDAVVATLSGAAGSLTCAPWSDMTRVVPFGGYRGGGVELPDSPANRYQGTSVFVRLAPNGTNTLDWQRDGGGETLSDAVMTTFVVEWGAGWTVQHAAVAGSSGGDGMDAPEEYTTAAIAPVARANTWVWGTGIRADAGIGDCAESCVVTLGDGVNLNAVESAVAVGSEYTDAYSFDVYALTHPALAVDHRFKPDGDLKGLDIPVAVAPAAPGARFAWLYNGCNGTSSRFPRPRMWSRYTADDTVAISRGYDGAEFPAWIQGIDFSGLGHGHTD